jgi:hypothetical protein
MNHNMKNSIIQLTVPVRSLLLQNVGAETSGQKLYNKFVQWCQSTNTQSLERYNIYKRLIVLAGGKNANRWDVELALDLVYETAEPAPDNNTEGPIVPPLGQFDREYSDAPEDMEVVLPSEFQPKKDLLPERKIAPDPVQGEAVELPSWVLKEKNEAQ